ncbi:5'-3' exonuclease [Thermoactinospora rubra]|uniref:5'-3' exonuclease n=1 Tax=Thermoactinospora rubra TaxID=1088767 RepID=UPI001F0A9C7E|nr:5'-3' exonuclease [Thermoactinospora rubra]
MEAPLLLVDGHNLLWRAAFGFPAPIYSRDKSRELTGVFGFFALLRVAIREEIPHPPEVIVVFDGEYGSAARKQADAAYKANRPTDEAVLKPIRALPDVKRGLDAYGIAWMEVEDAEADDVIATLVRHSPGRHRLIMSGDRDFYQLLTDDVHVLNTAMHPGKRHIGPAQVIERYQVMPAQWPCFRALCGDPSDNIPGVSGIGPATAARLLADGLTLEDLPASGRLTGAKGQKILQAFDQVLAWRQLIRTRTDVAVPYLPTGQVSPVLPRPAEIVEKLGLW